ncbi:hypothetical protein B0H10DRAFT_1961208 [Mycena sp. CBHHK59/15]|nr:hypothetical protein B0H10DRAFT_1961208 [Mycena sp. CBHHK59/15]
MPTPMNLCQCRRNPHDAKSFGSIMSWEDQARAVGTAVEREARWRTDPKPATGNSANAAAAASAVATIEASIGNFRSHHRLQPTRDVDDALLSIVPDAGVAGWASRRGMPVSIAVAHYPPRHHDLRIVRSEDDFGKEVVKPASHVVRRGYGKRAQLASSVLYELEAGKKIVMGAFGGHGDDDCEFETLRSYNPSPRSGSDVSWAAIDTALAKPRFHTLQQLSVRNEDPTITPYTKVWLPLTAAHGILA